jgi:hypothetical protein
LRALGRCLGHVTAATCVQRDRSLELTMKSMACGLMEGMEGIRNPCNLLKIWSGRPDSNRRRPAWEDDCKLETKNIAFPGTSFWRLRIPSFRPVLPSRIKRSTNGAHELAKSWEGRSSSALRLPNEFGEMRAAYRYTVFRCLARVSRSCGVAHLPIELRLPDRVKCARISE